MITSQNSGIILGMIHFANEEKFIRQAFSHPFCTSIKYLFMHFPPLSFYTLVKSLNLYSPCTKCLPNNYFFIQWNIPIMMPNKPSCRYLVLMGLYAGLNLLLDLEPQLMLCLICWIHSNFLIKGVTPCHILLRTNS